MFVHLFKGEIYLVDLGETEGSEVKKKRPCAVVQNNIGGKYAPTSIVVPITHRSQRNQPTQLRIVPDFLEKGSGLVDGMALAEQIRTVDRCRIGKKIGKLNAKGIVELDKAILIAMGIEGIIKEEA